MGVQSRVKGRQEKHYILSKSCNFNRHWGREDGRQLKLAKIKTQSGSQSTTYLRGRHPGVRCTWERETLSSGVGMRNRPSRVGGEGSTASLLTQLFFLPKGNHPK